MMVETDVKLDEKSLSGFLLYHNYMRPAGILSVVISVAAVVLLILRWGAWTGMQKGMLVFLALMFTVIQPLMLIVKGRKQLKMEVFQESFHYRFDENGVTISQGDDTESCTWDSIRKIVYRKNALYVYTSTVHAFVVPRKACGEKFDELVSLMKECKKKK